MKKLLLLSIFLFSNNILLAQDTGNSVFENLITEGKYSEILDTYKDYNEEEFSPIDFYYIGVAYYDSKDYDNAINFFGKAIEKEAGTSKAYFYSGMAYSKKGDNVKALDLIDKAINMAPEINFYYSEKAVILINEGEHDDAVELLNKALTMEEPDGMAFYLLSDIYYKGNKPEESIVVLKDGLNKVSRTDEYYFFLLYNASLIEFELGNYTDSKNYIFEVLNENPEAYSVIPLVIQNYFALNNLDSAGYFQDMLYKLHGENKLDEDLEKSYCFERFSWNGYNVYGYESFEKIDNNGEYQRLHKQYYNFYNSDYDVEFSIQTERFNTFGLGELDFDYVMGKSSYEGDDFIHQTFGTLTLKDPVDYKLLKEHLFKILNNEVNPTTSSRSKNK